MNRQDLEGYAIHWCVEYYDPEEGVPGSETTFVFTLQSLLNFLRDVQAREDEEARSDRE